MIYEGSKLSQTEHDLLTCLTCDEESVRLDRLTDEFELMTDHSGPQIAVALALLKQKRMILSYEHEGKILLRITRYGEDVINFRSSTERNE